MQHIEETKCGDNDADLFQTDYVDTSFLFFIFYISVTKK